MVTDEDREVLDICSMRVVRSGILRRGVGEVFVELLRQSRTLKNKFRWRVGQDREGIEHVIRR